MSITAAQPASGTRARIDTPEVSVTPESDEAPLPAEIILMLRGAAAKADALTQLLDDVRAHYRPGAFSGPDPVNVALDQAAAAAHDLSTNTQLAIQAILDR